MIGALITLIVYLLIVGLLYWLVIYVIGAIPIPDPPARIIKIALTVLLVLIIIVLLLDLFGMTRSGLDLPRMNPSRFDRNVYFNAVRDPLFEGALEQVHVDGQSVILAVAEHGAGGTPINDIRWIAYMLATTYHETAYRMWPITEYGSQDYLEGKEYYPYVGRGFVQLTWEENYRNASAALGLIDERDLVEHPELALDSLIATRVMFRGMSEGWFTGAKFGQFFSDEEDNPYDARTIINAHDDAKLIEGYHDLFLFALESARIDEVA